MGCAISMTIPMFLSLSLAIAQIPDSVTQSVFFSASVQCSNGCGTLPGGGYLCGTDCTLEPPQNRGQCQLAWRTCRLSKSCVVQCRFPECTFSCQSEAQWVCRKNGVEDEITKSKTNFVHCQCKGGRPCQ